VSADLSLLTGTRVVLTGCAANIGRATAHLFARHGARLYLVDIDPAAAETASELSSAGTEVYFRRADVSDERAVQGLWAEAAEVMGGVDVVVNNAGVQRAGPTTEFALEDWDAVLGVNARSCFLMAKYGVPVMTAGGGGVVVNMASLAGVHGVAGLAAYCASKGAIVALSRSLAAEFAADNIRVNSICPGFVESPFNAPIVDFVGGPDALERDVRNGVPLGRQGTPDEVANVMLFLASNLSSYMTGQTITVDGGVVL